VGRVGSARDGATSSGRHDWARRRAGGPRRHHRRPHRPGLSPADERASEHPHRRLRPDQERPRERLVDAERARALARAPCPVAGADVDGRRPRSQVLVRAPLHPRRPALVDDDPARRSDPPSRTEPARLDLRQGAPATRWPRQLGGPVRIPRRRGALLLHDSRLDEPCRGEAPILEGEPPGRLTPPTSHGGAVRASTASGALSGSTGRRR
jgi:hypothetical protein